MDPGESRHCVKVLRKAAGDEIHIVDGLGGLYRAKITSPDPRQCAFEVLEKSQSTGRSYHVHIAIAPTKNIDRLEWFVEKATEIGIDEISFPICQNSERKVVKTDRLEKKAIAAMKQSLKAELPKINPVSSLGDVIQRVKADHTFIAQVDTGNPKLIDSIVTPGANSCVLIGPEGDFSKEELQLASIHGWTKVSLGPSRLRTETAGLAACHILNLINQ